MDESSNTKKNDISPKQKYYTKKKDQVSKKLYIKTHKNKLKDYSIKVQRVFDEEKENHKYKLVVEEQTKEKRLLRKGKQVSYAGRNFIDQKIRENETDTSSGIEATRKGFNEGESLKESSERLNKFIEKKQIQHLEKLEDKYKGKIEYEKLKERDRNAPQKKHSNQKKQRKKKQSKKKKGTDLVNKLKKAIKSIATKLLSILESKVAVIILCIILIFMLLVTVIPSLFMMLISSSSFLDCWLSDPEEIEKVELEYTRMETELERKIDDMESGYDSYTYQVGEIKHNPVALINYLSAEHVEFTYEQVQEELKQIFNRQYHLSTQVTETETETKNEKGKAKKTTSTNLTITLDVTPIESLAILDFAGNEEASELYTLYCSNNGGLQFLKPPIELAWYSYVSSYYGYAYENRMITKNCGLTMICIDGSNVMSMCDGTVEKIDKAGKFGQYVQVKYKEYTINYAHLKEAMVKEGQKVKAGDVLATSTYNLYVEISNGKDYINPVFYIENGKGIYPGFSPGLEEPDISLTPGSNEQKVWTYLKGIGFSNAGAAAVLGNMRVESNFNPQANNNNHYFGLCQWGGGRWAGNPISLSGFADKKGKPWTDFQLQLSYFKLECSKSYGTVFTLLQKADDVSYAADYFCVYYEGCVGTGNGNYAISQINGKPYQALGDRIAYAKQYYEIYANK